MAGITVNTKILRWAIDRSEIPLEVLKKQFRKIEDWLQGQEKPSITQLEKFARKTRTAFGYFLLNNIPDETLPVSNFRTVKDKPIYTPSPELLDTVHSMLRRQNWMREYLIDEKEDPLPFVGSITTNTEAQEAVKKIKEALKLTEWTAESSNWEETMTIIRRAVDNTGILLVKNGIVENNTHRKLKVEEFRGFVLIDQYAPLVFINGSDFEGAQLFTLIHELVHVWLGVGAVFNLESLLPYDNVIEKYCNKVAAEFLVPESKLQEFQYEKIDYKYLAGLFKVSPIVIARRVLDLGYITKDQFFEFYNTYKEEFEIALKVKKEKRKQGGNFYNLQNTRIGKRFASAIFGAVKEGKITYGDAFNLTGLYGKAFYNYSQKVESWN